MKKDSAPTAGVNTFTQILNAANFEQLEAATKATAKNYTES